MYEIRVHFDSGDHIDTRINGSVDIIVNYYLDHKFPFEDETGRETTATARCVEFLNVNPIPWKSVKITIRRIFSLSDAFMARHQLFYKYRADFDIHYPNGSHIKSGCAYIPGMF